MLHTLAHSIVHGVTRAIMVLGEASRVADRLSVHTEGGSNTRDGAWERYGRSGVVSVASSKSSGAMARPVRNGERASWAATVAVCRI